MKYLLKPIPIILLLLISFTSCKKDVKLPIIGIRGIQDTIYNNSAIWIFYKATGNDTIAELNRKNKIANTHWIFNVDRRLSLKHIIPHIQKMQERKAAPSPHDNGEITHMYYSYVDTLANKLSMVLFDSIQYNTSSEFKSDPLFQNYKHLRIEYNKANLLTVNDSLIAMNQLNNYIKSNLDSIPLYLYLNLDKNTSYGQYIHLKATLEHVKNDSIVVANEEFVN